VVLQLNTGEIRDVGVAKKWWKTSFISMSRRNDIQKLQGFQIYPAIPQEAHNQNLNLFSHMQSINKTDYRKANTFRTITKILMQFVVDKTRRQER